MELHESSSNHNHTIAHSYDVAKNALRLFFCMWFVALGMAYAQHADLGSVMTIGVIIALVLCMSIIQEKNAYALLATIQEKESHNLADQADWQVVDYAPSNTVRSSFYSWTDYVIEQTRFTMRKAEQSMRYLFSYVCAQISIMIGAVLLGLPELFTVSHLILLTGITIIFLQPILGTRFVYPLPSHSKRLFIMQSGMSISMFSIVYNAIPMVLSALLIFYANYKDDLAYACTMALVTWIVFQAYHAWNCRRAMIAFHDTRKTATLTAFIGIVAMAIMMCIATLYTACAHGLLRTVPLGFADWKIIFSVVIPMLIIECLIQWKRHSLDQD